jgi:4-hydroxy-tetrahydrodipicolinate synthase
MYSGNDNETLPILSLGGHGVISVASHLVGRQIQEMIDSAVQGRRDRAAQLHHHLLPLFNALFIVSNPIPIKYALSRLGFMVGNPRLPLTPPDEKTAATIDAVLKNYHIDLPID